ncbi:MAG: major facilitator superfamily 1 [Conexibacter sp.]|nr:major facilitator superfamily 1 [Conexibacter sp.]
MPERQGKYLVLVAIAVPDVNEDLRLSQTGAPGSGGEAWLIGFRVVQGAFGAILFPGALAIVAQTFEARERGKALAISTDALNRAPRGSFGEVPGVTQTVRYFASSLGLAMLGTIFINETGGYLGSAAAARGAYAEATKTVFLAMAGVMAVSLVVAVGALQSGIPEQVTTGEAS